MIAGRLVASTAAVMTLLTGMAVAQAPPSASAAWVAEPGAGATSTTAYALIENPTMYEVFVVTVTTDAAGTAEVAEGPGDTAKTVRELSVPAYGSTELKPGGMQIRLKDLKRALKAGDTVALTLTLDSGAVIKVEAPVKK